MTTAKAQARRIAARALRDRFALLLAALSLFAAGVVLLRNASYGPAISYDATVYISVARSLLDGDGFVQFDSRPYTRAAPLYPTLLAAAGAPGFDPRDAAGPLNAAVFGLTVFAAGWWLRRRVRSQFLLAFGCLAVALSAPLARFASNAMSESLFILLTVLALYHADRRAAGGGRSTLIWAIAFTALACLTRYVGVSLIAAIALMLALPSGASRRRNLGESALFVAAPAAPLCLWLLLPNPSAPQDAASDYVSGFYLSALFAASPAEVFGRAAAFFDRLYLAAAKGIFDGLPLGGFGAMEAILRAAARAAAAGALASAVAATGCALIRYRRGPDERGAYAALSLVGVFSAAYIAMILAALSLSLGRTWFDGRYIAVLYIPALLAGTLVLDMILDLERRRGLGGMLRGAPGGKALANWATRRRWDKARAALLGIGAAALSLWLAYGAATIGRGIAQANSENPEPRLLEAAHPRFANSDVLRHMRDAPIEGPTLSNIRNFILYINTDIHAPRLKLPKLDKPEGTACLARVAANSEDDPHIVWFYDLDEYSVAGDYAIDAAFIRALPWAQPVAELSDGAIFRVDRQALATAMGGAWAEAATPIPLYHPGAVGPVVWRPADDGSCEAVRQHSQYIHRC